jgi:hypothetical protein
MTRAEAIHLLAHAELRTLSRPAREALLLGYWGVDADDPEYGMLPESLRAELDRGDDPGDAADAKYDPLLLLAILHQYVGVINEYLEGTLAQRGHGTVSVEGVVEPLFACPCCRYRTLPRRGEYDICRVCFWEDSGAESPEAYSGPNRMTLGDAQRNFATFGACTERERASVLPDGPARYARAE